MLGSAERRKVRLISRKIIFKELQRMHVITIQQRYRQTDGQTTVGLLTMAVYTALRYASRGNKGGGKSR